MLLVGQLGIGEQEISRLFKAKFNVLYWNYYKYTTNDTENDSWPINYIEDIKASMNKYKITYIEYQPEIVICLQTLNISFTAVCKQDDEFYEDINNLDNDKIILDNDETLGDVIYDLFNSIDNVQSDIKLNNTNTNTNTNVVPVNNKLTLEKLLDDNVELTEADARELKTIPNKLKVGLLLQAKSRLKMVLKFTNVLDKMYDELINRIDSSITTTDTASLLTLANNISKTLSDTNNFIASLINDKEMSNFFIIDNSNVININDSGMSMDQREKIRKAVNIVMSNIDNLEQGNIDNLIDPNNIIEGETNANK